MKSRCFSMTILAMSLAIGAVDARASAIVLGAASGYAVLGQAGVTNTGASLISGNVGGSAGTPAVTGFPPGTLVAPAAIVTGSATAFFDATTAYNTAQGSAGAINLSGDTLGVGIANNLASGVYVFNSSAALNGILMLDAGGSNTASWIFQIGSTLTTASASSVEIINAGSAGSFTGDITWAVGSAATLGTTTAFQGTILSQAGDVLNTGASVGCGRVISLVASVTLDDNVISSGNCIVTGGAGGTGGVGTGGTGGTGTGGTGGTGTDGTGTSGTGTGGTGTGGTGGTGGASGAVVPEPKTFVLLASGLLALFLRSIARRSSVSC